jgi:ribosome biogenesis GTPase
MPQPPLTITEMISLEDFGWNNFFQSNKTNIKHELSTGRITSIQGFKYFVITEKGELETELSGKLLYGASPDELPKLGDWVSLLDYGTTGYIVEVLPRINELSRKNPGRKTEKQVLATNIDHALIVQGLDRDFNIMRLERYLVQLAACRIKPIVILNKADLITNPEHYTAEVQKLQRDCPVYFCSTYNGTGMDDLRNSVLQRSKTYILIGSSGVGKSSLLNSLMNRTIQQTNNTSDFNSKGKHTTTTRDLFALPNGSLLIDTPGMREFGMTFEEGQNPDEIFPAIQKFSSGCRYADCKHINDPGCAVIEALDTGELEREVYDSYIKLLKEQRRFEINIEDKKKLNKQFGKMTREAKDYRKKYKY